jgi:uncharacterized protein (TIGR00251 family)
VTREWLAAREGGIRLSVHVQPRAATSAVAGMHGDAIKIRLTAAPVDGAANEALTKFLAEALAVPARAVRIVGGAQSRSKVVEVDGVALDDARRLLATPG